MIDRDVLLEALGAICNAKVTSVQKQRSQGALLQTAGVSGGAAQPQLLIKRLICAVVDGDQTCQVSKYNSARIQSGIKDYAFSTSFLKFVIDEDETGKSFIIDEDELFDPAFDYDFTNQKDTQTYYRGGEVYERPCGWNRFALKVLNKYDENTWLGTQFRGTQSVQGEWPVSYHGTSDDGAASIIEGHYKAGPRKMYGRGIYSTPDLSEAAQYAKRFKSKTTGKWYKVILQNRINHKYREKHCNDKYWVVSIPAGTSDKEEQIMVERAIRPYGLLLKEA